jgi:hypothetical protein
MSGSRCGCTFSLRVGRTGGGLAAVGTMAVSHSFFRVPERDRERLGFVAMGFVLLRDCLMSGRGGGVDTPVASHPASWRLGGLRFGWRPPTDWVGCSGCY